MQRLSSFSHAWTHVVQYRAHSLLPCPFYHKSQSSEASNHKSTDEATIISLFADSASPSSSSRNHLTALVLLVVLVKDFLDANKTSCRISYRPLFFNIQSEWIAPVVITREQIYTWARWAGDNNLSARRVDLEKRVDPMLGFVWIFQLWPLDRVDQLRSKLFSFYGMV